MKINGYEVACVVCGFLIGVCLTAIFLENVLGINVLDEIINHLNPSSDPC